jgi:hypothetical protein
MDLLYYRLGGGGDDDGVETDNENDATSLEENEG